MSRWAVILAGGEGSRIRPTIRRWLGMAVPKQYCTFCGTRSMLEHTVDRAARLVDTDRIVTVIGSGHKRFLSPHRHPGVIIEQPVSRGTGPGVLLPLACIRAVDPEATVLIVPSDQFIFPEEHLPAILEEALSNAEALRRIVLVGARADRPETDYGWIETGDVLGRGLGRDVREVRRYIEKPGKREALKWFRKGHLWNTMIMAVKADLLWSLAEQFLPRLSAPFSRVTQMLQESAGTLQPDSGFLESFYSRVEPADFSYDFLTNIPEQSAVIELGHIQWCDWGRAERIADTLLEIGRRATFTSVPDWSAPEEGVLSP